MEDTGIQDRINFVTSSSPSRIYFSRKNRSFHPLYPLASSACLRVTPSSKPYRGVYPIVLYIECILLNTGNYDKERHILKLIDDIKANWKRGLCAVAIFIVVWIVVFFIAFMTAFGNDSPMARAILKGFELFVIIANPLWGIPIAFLIGIYTKRK
jgi:hypothetical protein